MFNTDRKYWGWGVASVAFPEHMTQLTRAFLQAKFGVIPAEPQAIPALASLNMPEPAQPVPYAFADIMTDARYDRAVHTYGKSFRDTVRALAGNFLSAPDWVAYPRHEDDITQLLDWAEKNNIAVIPFGGGSSVVGGVEVDQRTRDRYAGVLSLDLCCLNQVLEIDKTSRCARVQGGVYGPALEQQLKEHGYSLRHFPQSFEFSTVGGWIATRAGGHYATNYTHIDDFVESVRMVTPKGVMQTRRLPGNGAGPQEERLVLGSEGVLGVITEAWLRLQEIPQYRAACTVQFEHFAQGVAACRRLAQSGLFPANARLIEKDEALFMGAGDGVHHILVLGFESAQFSQADKLQQALAICEAEQGKPKKPKISEGSTQNAADESADQWKKSFLLAPYLRDEVVRMGFISETFETCTTWENFPAYDAAIRQAIADAVAKTTGQALVTCRFTHLYPDGPAPYYTVIAPSSAENQLAHWAAIKQAASDAIIANGGTITHHHAVGKDHREHFLQQNSPLSLAMLRAAKQAIDPQGILNPGTLL